MAKFLQGNELNAELSNLFEKAKTQLLLISPFIKLHDRFISSLRVKKDNPDLKIIIVFGKNEEDMSRSMKQIDFDFFKEFPNIEIRYEKRLHAKYYANDFDAIITSMNLYNYSQDNNIEAGVKTKLSIAGNLIANVTGENNLDSEAWNYFKRIVDQSELLFQKIPHSESRLLGLGKKYKDSTTEVDKLSDFFLTRAKYESPERRKNHLVQKKAAIAAPIISGQSGYCIRTGKKIPFNPKRPMSDEAYQSWAQFKNEDYAEKYCHCSGEFSNGETTFAKPILRKNWKKAKEIFNL